MRILANISDLTKEQYKEWREMIDAVILHSKEWDIGLKHGLEFLDKEALKRKITIYEMILVLYEKSELLKRIESWQEAKAL